MQASNTDIKKKYAIPALVVIAAAAVVLLSNRPGKMPNGMTVIQSETQYNELLDKVTVMSKSAVIKFNTGIELEKADKDKALECAKSFDTMNAFRPDMAAGYFEAGLLYYLAGDTDTSLERLNQSLADSPLPSNLKMEGDKAKVDAIEADCHRMISQIAFDRHDYKTAEEEASLAVKSSSHRPSYYVCRAQAEVQLNKIPEAKKDLAAALKLNPTYLPATRLDDFLAH